MNLKNVILFIMVNCLQVTVYGVVTDRDLRFKKDLNLLTNVDMDPKEDISINMGTSMDMDTNMGIDISTDKSEHVDIDGIDRDLDTDTDLETDHSSAKPSPTYNIDEELLSLNRQVLPKGIWHPRIMFGTVSEVSTLYTNTGVLTSIGRFNHTFNSEFLKKFDARFQDLVTALNELTGSDIGERLNLGSLRFSGGPEVSYLGLVLAYGITNNWTVGIGVPIVNMYGSVAVEATGENNIAEISRSLPQDVRVVAESYQTELLGGMQDLAQLEGPRLIEQFHEVVEEKGFKSIVDKPSTRSLGDIQLFSFYNYFNKYPWSFYLMVMANLPTGPKDDPDDLVDFPNLAQRGLLLKTYHQYQFSRNLTLGAALSYYWRLSDKIVKRIPNNVDDILPDPDTKELLYRNLGDITSIDTFASYDLLGFISFNFGLSWSFQSSDRYQGQRQGANYFLLGKDTESHFITGKLGIHFSSIPWFRRGKFLIPLIIGYNYSDILYGRNAIREVRHEASLLLFF